MTIVRFRREGPAAAMIGVLLAMLAACGQAPDGIEAVGDFDLERYLGRWYEIARLDHRFERGLQDVSADYTRLPNGDVEVVNRGFDPEAGEWRRVRGRAKLAAVPDVGAFRVSFFRPFYGGYNVIALDHDAYRWALVCGPSRSYLWILARTPTLDPAIVDRLRDEADRLGFDVGQLIMVRHRDE
jgi:apolipoprotein D and lipocalin family protein